MNPLFTAHLIADFLLQPDDLIAWKKESVGGIFMHSLIHLIVMSAMILPFNVSFAPVIFAIAGIHAVIDQWKISYQKRYSSFARIFLIDQLAHLVTIFGFFLLAPLTIPFWKTGPGISISMALLLCSLMIGFHHMGIFKDRLPETRGHRKTTTLLILGTFAMYLIPAILL